MHRVILVLSAVGALAVAATAVAGGWATAGVSPLPPEQVEPGAVWKPEIRVLQHGRTPVDGWAKPAVVIRNADTGQTKTFAARYTGRDGVYRADVVFPAEGTWSVAVNDGFGAGQVHTFRSVGVGSAAGASRSSTTWTAAGSATLALALAALVVAGRRRPPAPRGAASPST